HLKPQADKAPPKGSATRPDSRRPRRPNKFPPRQPTGFAASADRKESPVVLLIIRSSTRRSSRKWNSPKADGDCRGVRLRLPPTKARTPERRRRTASAAAFLVAKALDSI